VYDSIRPPFGDGLAAGLALTGDGLAAGLALTGGGLAAGLALIFDMDGVLVNSNPVHRQAWARFNLRYGLQTTPAMLERMYGKRNDDIVRDFFGDGLSPEEVAARGAAKERLYRQMIDGRIEEILVPGVRRFLDLHARAPLAVASNAEPENVRFVIDRARLGDYFRAVVDGHQASRPKPDPEIYLRAAALLGVPAPNCLVFEDSHSGVAAGMAAGMRVIGIRTTYDNLPGASICVDNFKSGELDSWLAAQARAV
jgi:beta-phosphoglucomutase family hydrolase